MAGKGKDFVASLEALTKSQLIDLYLSRLSDEEKADFGDIECSQLVLSKNFNITELKFDWGFEPRERSFDEVVYWRFDEDHSSYIQVWEDGSVVIGANKNSCITPEIQCLLHDLIKLRVFVKERIPNYDDEDY